MSELDSGGEITRIEVDQLLGRFNHVIDFPEDQSFVILYGANGIGKTGILELINATFSGDLYKLIEIPFKRARFTFSNGSTLDVSHKNDTQETIPGVAEDAETADRLQLRYTSSENESFSWQTPGEPPGGAPRSLLLRRLERLELVSRVGPGLWRDLRTGERLSTEKAYARYYSAIMEKDAEIEGARPELMAVLSSQKVHLVETQRLLNLERSGKGDQYDRSEHTTQRPTVLEYSDDFVSRRAKVFAQNTQTSQNLDRSFPRRLLERETSGQDFTETDIRERYEDQSKIRERLAEVSVLDAAGELPLPSRKLDDWEQLVLWTYLNDTEEKLSTFKDLLDRVDLFRGIVNSRFTFVKLLFGPNGFRFLTTNGREIEASKLSSGEQHELVLAYDLLFNVEPGSLVLIDEPEISLHVAWQKEFINDLIQIAKLRACRFIVATHSPQIIHKHWHHAISLKTGIEGDNGLEFDE